VEAPAQALDVIFVHFPFSAQDFRDNAGSSENVDEVFLPEMELIHEETAVCTMVIR
jgi:hypothetical protein